MRYVKSCAERRKVVRMHELITKSLVSVLNKQPEVYAGWRARKFWRKTYDAMVHVHRSAHWELDVRRNTKPLSKASKP